MYLVVALFAIYVFYWGIICHTSCELGCVLILKCNTYIITYYSHRINVCNNIVWLLYLNINDCNS